MNSSTVINNILYALSNSDILLGIAGLMLSGILIFLCLYLFVSFVKSLFLSSTKDTTGLKALADSDKILWVDKPGSKPLFDKRYRINAKPDFITLINGVETLIEYKSRFGPVYASDIVQAKASALCARSNGYPVSRCIVETGSGLQKHITLPKDDNELYLEIEPFITIARQGKLGHALPPTDNRKKCHQCSYRTSCRYQ